MGYYKTISSIKTYKAKEKLKKEEEKLQNKLEKEKQKILKQQEKESKKIKVVTENIVIDPSIIINTNNNVGCCQILKCGPRKGQSCGNKIYNENSCKRHFLVNNK
jgi:hypothetical protein